MKLKELYFNDLNIEVLEHDWVRIARPVFTEVPKAQMVKLFSIDEANETTLLGNYEIVSRESDYIYFKKAD